ncbi:hypothetical protein N7520_010147 [Penicillium odoratum]|uniref:uncharacterized protein n=1 Tax=Penicillium odoratum TaxID=1167516 RepID=UPI0025495B31|nr:uncharacterized protein N7520_010147 [Penicillium odoratum]KAJ5753230.1 hypothetical protein N7520_010147 [Penicillium odoratum]
MSSPPINVPGWQITVGIILSLTFIIIIEKIYRIHVNISKGDTMAAFPGWAQILGPGETQAALLYRWIDAHRTLHQPQPTASTPAPAPQMSPSTAQQSGYISSLKSKQLMVDAN